MIGAIIPHAGGKYAGDCRNEVFNKMVTFINQNYNYHDNKKNINNDLIIIYISALHSPTIHNSKYKNHEIFVSTNNEDIYNDFINTNIHNNRLTVKNRIRNSYKKITIKNRLIKNRLIKNRLIKNRLIKNRLIKTDNRLEFTRTNIHTDNGEHSYKWVEKELFAHFQNIKGILVLTPSYLTNTKLLAQKIYNFSQHSNSNIIIFATTDLIHYGPRFSRTRQLLQSPFLLDKIKKEERMIEFMKTSNINKFKTISQDILCGFQSVQTLLYISRLAKWSGQICDYYDSHMKVLSKKMNDPMLKYCIDYEFNENDTFVSYVSIFYFTHSFYSSRYNLHNTIEPIDIKMSLGLLRNYITLQTKYPNIGNIDINLPIWSTLYNIKNGIFLGTSVGTSREKNNKTNCSKGNFETLKSSSAENIENASITCLEDATNRWHLPYDKNNLHKYTYKIELLEPMKNWKIILQEDLPKILISHNKLDPSIGVFLQLKTGQSATYLPIVAEENPYWSIDKYMNSLTKKAISYSSQQINWREMVKTIKVYKSIAYYWRPNRATFETILKK